MTLKAPLGEFSLGIYLFVYFYFLSVSRGQVVHTRHCKLTYFIVFVNLTYFLGPLFSYLLRNRYGSSHKAFPH